MSKLILVDAHSYLHRAFHALPPLTTSKGEHVGAILGFTRMMLKILSEQCPEYMAVCFDAPGRTFRDDLYSEYKATRRETDESLRSQFPLSREVIKAMGLASFEVPGFEADDLIATLARKAEKDGHEVVIVSSDKDILQIVNEKIKVLNVPKQGLFDPATVKERWGVEAAQIIDVLTLMGDSSDNIPGVEGIGEKTAVKLIQEYGSVQGLLAAPNGMPTKLKEKLAQSRDQIMKSRELVILREDVPLDVAWDKCKARCDNQATLLPVLKRLEFFKLISELFTKGSFKAPQGEIDKFSTNYSTVLTSQELDALVGNLKGVKRIAVDVETTGLDIQKLDLVGISLSWKKEFAAYIPVGHHYLGVPNQPGLKAVLDALRPILEDESVEKVGQNLKFDFSVLRKAGLRMKNLYFDTMIASYCLDPSKPSHRLKDLVSEFLQRDMTRIQELVPKSGRGAPKEMPMDQVPIEKVSPYACADADCAFQLLQRLAALLKEKKCESLFFDLEMPLVEILSDMEMTGIKVDAEYLGELDVKFTEQIRELEICAHKLAGEEFNLNSSKQLSSILFEKLKLPALRRTKTGYSTDEEVLNQLCSSHELPRILLKHREVSKLKSTYIDGLLSQVNAANSRIHTSFNQAGTSTGRLSSSDPNLQNIPIRSEQGRMIRRAFVPEKGTVFLSADYSQIDLRVLSHLSGDPVLSQAFREGADIHRSTASQVFRVPPDEVTDAQRSRAKTINFGIVYGQQAFGLSQGLGISMAEAQAMIESYFQKYSGVKEWIEKTKKEARIEGSVRTLLGRVRYLPEIHSKNAAMRAFAERTAINTPVQGTSADIIKAAMINIHRKLKGKPDLKIEMLVQVHDDLLFEVPEDRLEDAALFVKSEMENALRLSVPVIVDLKTGKNWADLEAFAAGGRKKT